MNTYERIKELCKRKGMNVSDLEKQAGLGKKTTYNWATSKPSADSLQRVAQILDCSVEYLLTGDAVQAVSVLEVPTNDDLKIALFGGDAEVTDEMWEEAKRYAQYLKERNRDGK